MTKIMEEFPTPTSLQSNEVKELSTKLTKLWENMDANVIQSIAKAEKYQDSTKKANSKKTIQDKWSPVQTQLNEHLAKAKVYCKSVATVSQAVVQSPGSTSSSQLSRHTLERLPLPTFSGKKIPPSQSPAPTTQARRIKSFGQTIIILDWFS